MTSLGTTTSPSRSVTDNEALIESSFRRLLTAIDAERERLRIAWEQVEQEQATSYEELDRLRQATTIWCQEERAKIDAEWTRLIKLREQMSVESPEKATEVLEINCSGELFSVPRSDLCSIPSSYLNHIFSDAFISEVPQDGAGHYFLDFNPRCFGMIVDYLRMVREQGAHHDLPVPPPVPAEHQQSMDLLAEALELKPFLHRNRLASGQKTSLRVTDSTIEATYPGWQVMSAKYPLRMSGSPYFEVKVMANPEPSSGGLAIGVCGHVPDGTEVHSIRFPNAVLLNGKSGLVSDSVVTDTVAKGHELAAGSVIGVKYDIAAHTLHWYINKMSIGYCTLKPECLEKMRTLYPIFALYVKGQRIEVELNTLFPAARKEMGATWTHTRT